MKSRLMRWLDPPAFDDDEKSQRAKILNVILLTVMAIILIVMASTFFDQNTPVIIRALDTALLISFILLRIVLQRGNTEFVGLSIVLTGFAAVTGLSASLGTVRTPTTTAYVLVVVAGAILFQRIGLILTLAAVSLAVLGLILAENAGWLPQPNYSVTFTQWVTFSAIFGLTGFMTHLIYRYMQEALTKSKTILAEREQAEDSTRKLLQAVNQSPSSIVITDLDGNIEYVNPRFTQVTGYTAAEVLGRNPRILGTAETPASVHNSLWQALLAGKEWRGEFTNRKKSGEIYQEFAVIAPILDENGKATHYVAVKEDITESKRIEEELRDSELRYRALFNQVHDGVFILDLHGRHIIANPRASEMLGYTAEELLDLSVNDLSAELDQSAEVSKRLFAGEQVPLYERRFRKKNGEAFPVEISVELVRDENGNPSHIQSVVRDISSRKAAEEALRLANEQLQLRILEVEKLQKKLSEQALRDPLTGLYNRRYLGEALPREMIRMKRENKALSIIIADIDQFKIINDTYGHLVGDKILLEVAHLLQRYARGSDIVSRYGGEEFLLALPGATARSASQRAEEIRRKCAEIVFEHEGQALNVTMSFGVGCYPAHGEELTQVIDKADRALYQAKQSGRNKVVTWGDSSEKVL